MSGPPGFERFETSTGGPGRGLGPLARLRNALGGLFPGLRSVGEASSAASPALAGRLKLLAGLSVVLLVAAYLGPGLALGGSERPAGPAERGSAGGDQYDPETGAAGEPDEGKGEDETSVPRNVIPPGTGEDRPRSEAGNEGTGPSRPAPDHSPGAFVSGATAKRAAGGEAASRAGEFRPSIPVVSGAGKPVSYNARSYCRTYERGGASGSSRSPAGARAVFPLPEAYLDSYDDTWGAARPQGNHEGTDLMSPTGTPLYALTDGTVVRLSGANANGWNYLGGYTVMIRAAYSIGPIKKGDLFYYAHMDRETPLPVGARVEAGDQVGVVGDTGYGPEVTRGQFPPHLHLGWYDTTGTTAQAPSGAMNPYPLLEWIKRNGGTAAGGWGSERATERYCDYQERAADRPAANDGHDHDLPPGASAGSSADLDPRSPDPRPSPLVKRVRTETSQATARAEASHAEHSAAPQSSRAEHRRHSRNEKNENNERGESEETVASGETRPDPERRSRPPREDERPAPKPSPRGDGGEAGDDTSSRPPQPERPERDLSILPVVFYDEDADGRRDPGERALSGWVISASRGGEAVAGVSGERIGGLEPGRYRVSAGEIDGYLSTTPETARVRVGERRVARVSFGVVEAAELTVLACTEDGDRDEPCSGKGSAAWDLALRDESGRRVPASGTSGEPSFRDLLPGRYELSFAPRKPGAEPRTRELTLAPGEVRSLRLPDPGAPDEREDGDASSDMYKETPARETEEAGT